MNTEYKLLKYVNQRQYTSVAVPEAIKHKFLEAFTDIGLDYEKEKDIVRFRDLGRGIIHVLHNDRFVCSFNLQSEYDHRFSWRCKSLHLEDYIGKGYY